MNGNEMFNSNENVQNVNGQLGTGSQSNLEEIRATEEAWNRNIPSQEEIQNKEEVARALSKEEQFEVVRKMWMDFINDVTTKYDELLRKEEAWKKVIDYHNEVCNEYDKMLQQDENIGRFR